MNIFVLDRDPIIAARQLNDKHLIKMILESAQLLSTTVGLIDPTFPGIYKITHKNHPCSIWARHSHENFLWLGRHALEMCRVYTLKSNKVHKCEEIIRRCMDWSLFDTEKKFYYYQLTEHPMCMPDECKEFDIVKSYRKYYVMKKDAFNKWTYNEKPTWYDGLKNEIN